MTDLNSLPFTQERPSNQEPQQVAGLFQDAADLMSGLSNFMQWVDSEPVQDTLESDLFVQPTTTENTTSMSAEQTNALNGGLILYLSGNSKFNTPQEAVQAFASQLNNNPDLITGAAQYIGTKSTESDWTPEESQMLKELATELNHLAGNEVPSGF